MRCSPPPTASLDPRRRRADRRLLRDPRPQQAPDEAGWRMAGAEALRPLRARSAGSPGTRSSPASPWPSPRHDRPGHRALRVQPAVGRCARRRGDRPRPTPGEYDASAPARDLAGPDRADGDRPRRPDRPRSRTPGLRARSSAASSIPRATRWERFRDAPAAKHYHQAYRHGLLEHTLSVAQGVERRRPPTSPGSTATSPSPGRCCTTSASSRPTTTTRWRST